jgi:hypothetical protein
VITDHRRTFCRHTTGLITNKHAAAVSAATAIYNRRKNMQHKILSRHTDGAFCYKAWPTITKGSDGTLFVATSGID